MLVVSYETLRDDFALGFKQTSWAYMVVDEAHRLKNPASSVAKLLRSVSVDHMHLLTGTPLQNTTTELWARLGADPREAARGCARPAEVGRDVGAAQFP